MDNPEASAEPDEGFGDMFADQDLVYQEMVFEQLALGYLSIPDGRVGIEERDQAEVAYVAYFWASMARLAYQNYLENGRGAVVHRLVFTAGGYLTPSFDYVTPDATGALTLIKIEQNPSVVARAVETYDPDLEFVLLLLRPDATVNFIVVKPDAYMISNGLTPKALHKGALRSVIVRPN